MRLDEYCKRFGVSPVKLAEIAGITHQTLHNISTYKRDCKASVLMKISIATGGMVKMEDMVNMKLVNTRKRTREKQFKLPLSDIYMRSIPEN
jgi:DNA-binding XRE family transcriptional regulator